MEKIKIRIDNKLQTIDDINKEYIRKLKYVLLQNYEAFRECIGCYQHEFQVTGYTPYILRGWPVPFLLTFIMYGTFM